MREKRASAFVKENGCPNERFSLTGKEMNKDLEVSRSASCFTPSPKGIGYSLWLPWDPSTDAIEREGSRTTSDSQSISTSPNYWPDLRHFTGNTHKPISLNLLSQFNIDSRINNIHCMYARSTGISSMLYPSECWPWKGEKQLIPERGSYLFAYLSCSPWNIGFMPALCVKPLHPLVILVASRPKGRIKA